jgi:hypothetical protein
MRGEASSSRTTHGAHVRCSSASAPTPPTQPSMKSEGGSTENVISNAPTTIQFRKGVTRLVSTGIIKTTALLACYHPLVSMYQSQGASHCLRFKLCNITIIWLSYDQLIKQPIRKKERKMHDETAARKAHESK